MITTSTTQPTNAQEFKKPNSVPNVLGTNTSNLNVPSKYHAGSVQRTIQETTVPTWKALNCARTIFAQASIGSTLYGRSEYSNSYE